MKKTLCMIFASLIALSCFSCGETTTPKTPENPDTEAQTDAQTDIMTEETETGGIPEPELPELNYNGAKFTFLTRGRYSGSFEQPFLIAEAIDGEIVNDAIYNRNIGIEDKFDLELEFIENPDAAGDVQKLVMASDASVDVVDTQATALSSLSTQGYLVNLLKVGHLNLAADYWSENVMNDLQIDGHLFMMISDLSMSRLENANFLYFNKELLKDYDLESPYALMDENKWTIDKFIEYVNLVSKDLNGDGKYDRNDLFGNLYESGHILDYLVSCGITMTERDEENGLVCTVLSQKTDEVVNRFYECFHSQGSISYDTISRGADTTGFDNYWEWARTLFANRQFLFLSCGMFELMNLRDMKDDFGLAPMPKYDEAQEEYYHRINPQACIFAIPASCSDLERAGAVLEYGSWLSNRILLPAYYETTVKQKRIRDEKACEVVEIVRQTARYEIGEVYDLGITGALTGAALGGDLASKYSKREEKIKKAIDKLFDSISELE